MRDFAELFTALDATTSTNRKRQALQDYFSHAAPEDAAWAVYFLAGGKPRQTVPTRLLRAFASECAGLESWLFDESYHAVGDLAETISLILPPPRHISDHGLAVWVEQRLAPLRGATPEIIRSALFEYWDELDTAQRFLLGKLIGGGFRVGVSRLLVTRALAALTDIDSKLIAQRLVGWTDGSLRPTALHFQQLIGPPGEADTLRDHIQPYPFFLAHPLQQSPDKLGAPDDWLIEWKYDGIRAQIVHRADASSVWSRGEELISERFPELVAIPLENGTVLDGEILIWHCDATAPEGFSDLQQRIGRKNLSARMLQQLPAVLVAYDLLEQHGEDLRTHPLRERRQRLEQLVGSLQHPALRLSPALSGADWQALAETRLQARALGVEGMMIKALDSAYGVGRTKDVGVWWKWKIDPFSIDAVLIYAQAGHGRRASLYTDYTFAVWDDSDPKQRQLVPFAKAYSGLTDAEIQQVDQRVRKTTIERFGPVRSVRPEMVFEIGFEAIARSTRHKAGIAVRFPRILKWRTDKKIEDADTLHTLQQLLPTSSDESPT